MNFSPAKALVALLLLALLTPPATAAERFNSVYLSEFLALNHTGLLDNDGDRSPWIELHNASRTPVNLAGWFLTDNPAQPTKWRLPGVVLLPDKYLVLFASGKDRAKDLAHLHTNFKITPAITHLALFNSQTNLVSELPPAPQIPDHSDGRLPGEPAIRGHFTHPTPGRPNATSGPGFAPAITFSRPGGNFTTPFTLNLATPTTNATIRYTLDGKLPQSNSPAFTVPLTITNTTHLRARAYQPGHLPGPPHSEHYLRLDTNAPAFTSSLPIIVLHAPAQAVPISTRSTLAQLAIYEPTTARTSLTNPPSLTTRAGYHTRGSSSSGMPQASFAVQFVDEFNVEHRRSPVGLPAESEWILYAPTSYDPVLIHNPFIHQLSRDLGRYSPRTRFVELFLTRGNEPLKTNHYHGLYVLEERIKIGKHRVDLDRPTPEDLQPPAVTGGYLLKFDRTGPDEAGFGAGGATVVHVDPKEATLRLPQRAPQRDYLHQFFRDFDRTLASPNWKDPRLGYPALFDVPAAIDFHVLEVLSGNVDSLVLSTYFHKPRNGKITFGPHWDFDRALGSTDGRDANPRVWNTGPFFGGPWWPRLFSDPDFWQHWVDRWQQLRQTHFAVPNLHALIDRLAAEIADAQPRQYRRWGIQPRGGSYQGELNHMKNWLSNRVDFIDQQLTPPPRLHLTSGRNPPLVTLTASTNATIYFTLDGTDPRLPQGAIRTNAHTYTNTFPLPPHAHLVARAHNPKQRQSGGPPLSTPWSSPLLTNLVATPR